MSYPTKIENINEQPTFHFLHLDQEYFIYVGIEGGDGDNDPRKIYLCKPKLNGAAYEPDYLLSMNHWQIDEIDTNDMRKGVETLFLPKVNEYLSSLGGGGDSDYPITGSNLEQYNWIVENALQYSNGAVSLV